MLCVIPLAGPEFVRNDGITKPEYPVDGQPLLRKVLESRPWWVSGELSDSGLIFVLRDIPEAHVFHERKIRSWYPKSRNVFLGDFAYGAALSTLAGVAQVAEVEDVICVDLVDILYEFTGSPTQFFNRQEDLGGMVPVFLSESAEYSYLELNSDGYALRAAEKKVISKHASAGTYFFRNPAVLLSALALSLKHRDQVMHNNLFYVCPIMNGIIMNSLQVFCPIVKHVVPIK